MVNVNRYFDQWHDVDLHFARTHSSNGRHSTNGMTATSYKLQGRRAEDPPHVPLLDLGGHSIRDPCSLLGAKRARYAGAKIPALQFKTCYSWCMSGVAFGTSKFD